MINNIASIGLITRYLVDDLPTNAVDIFTYTTTPIFTLTESNPISITDVLVNGHSSGVTYTTSADKTQVTITSHLNSLDIVEIDYTCYKNWSDTEIQGYVQAAIVHVSVNNIVTFKIVNNTMYPEPLDEQANLIAMIASILINPQNISYRMPDVAVTVPKDLPTIDKVRKVIHTYKKDGPGVFYLTEDIFTNANFIT
jgi:hypothetical protein